MKNLYIFILCWFTINTVYCQTTIVIKGNIKNTKGENMPQELVTLKQVADSSLLSYAYSNENGNYELSYFGRESELLLVVSGLGIATQAKKISNQSQTVNFMVEEEEFQLKEVEIKAPKIYYNKDTINYSVATFSDEKDVVIGDVLKKMPGIDVSESGQISYQGKPINKFYIENMDMLNGRYGIATQNISAKDVSTVQVMENHKPIKAMDSLSISDQAAINLKLKEGAKGTFAIMAQLGIGASPLLWNEELTGMYFARKKQHISAYKTNNTGQDLSNELRSFTSDLNLPEETITNIQAPIPPDISKNRYYFNNSNAATVNNLFSLGKDKELNFNLIYYNDYEKRESESTSSYFVSGDSILKIGEVLQSATNTNRIETEVRYNENKDTKYFNIFLNVESSWEDDNGTVQNNAAINQRMNSASFRAQNTLHWIKRQDDKGFELYSQTGFRTTPHHLAITPGIYADLLNDSSEYAHLQQNARTQTFITKNSMSLLNAFVLGKIILRPIFGLDAEINNLSSGLYPCNEQSLPIITLQDSMKNDIQRNHFQARVALNFDYSIGKFKLNASFPISYNWYELNNKLFTANSENLNRFQFEPNVDLQYVLNRKVTINASAFSYQNMNGINELYDGYLLQTYRYLSRYDSRLAGFSGNTLSVKFDYKDIIRMFFAGIELSDYYSRNSVTFMQRFEDYLSVSSFVPQSNTSNAVLATGKISKGFDWKRLSAGLSVAYYTRTSQQIRQERLVDYRNNQYSASVRLSAVPLSWLIVSYTGAGQISKSVIANETSYQPIRSLSQTLNLDAKLLNKVMLGTQLEQYANSAIQNGKSLYFADIILTYVWKQIRLELDWTNIFDTKNYTMAYYDNLNAFASVYRIRPSEILLKVKMKLK